MQPLIDKSQKAYYVGPVTTLPLTLDQLIDQVHSDNTATGPLDHVVASLRVSGEMGQLGDHLVRYFIDEARSAGESWAAIGERLDVSRQAAQKRYATTTGDAESLRFSMFDKLVRDGKFVVVHAQEEARRRGVHYIGTEHILLGIAGEETCVGARALERCGASPEVLVAAVNGRVGVARGEPLTDKLPFTAKAQSVLRHSLRESVRLGHDYVGTGHLALGCLTVRDGMAAQILDNLGVTYEDLRPVVVELAPTDPPLHA